jgi:hypothetical protein
MAAISTTHLAQRIQHLLEERQQHADALAHVDGILEQIGAVLRSNHSGLHPGRKPGRPPMTAAVVSAPRKRRRRRGSFATTAEETILAFVKSNKNPIGREIEKHWKSEGRGATAANMLSKMVKARMLKRTPLCGEPGSRYSLA